MGAAAADGSDRGDSVDATELVAARVVELDGDVAVFAQDGAAASAAPAAGGNPDAPSASVGPAAQPVLICPSATVKIFARHVVAARSDTGAPVAELVIAELFQLTEDEGANSVTFFLGPVLEASEASRSASYTSASVVAASTVVEMRCSTPAQRRALYKLVCARRSAIEDGAV
jgi:hypothetical protein